MLTDPIADMLTRVRNGLRIRKEWVDVPDSKIKRGVAEVLKREGFISGFKTFEAEGKGTIRVFLKYGPEGEEIIRFIQRVSKPGRRVYKGYQELKPILRGVGISIVSTPQGILSDVECREKQVGGEVLACVY
jgi:small subunit ribosomal protein S8